MKKFMNEFKEFALRGNVMDMAIGIIIGAAFSDIVTSLTENFITPLINLFTHPKNMHFNPDAIATYFSNFMGSVVNFVIMAFILFCIMKAVNKAMTIGKKTEEAAPTTKKCPYCQSDIAIEATRCPHCTSELTK